MDSNHVYYTDRFMALIPIYFNILRIIDSLFSISLST